NHFGDFIKDVFKVGAYGLIFMVSTAYVVSRGVSKGIEKATKILMPTLIVIIVGLAIYAFTLPHASAGLKFYLQPNAEALNFKVVYNALGQAFFSLSLGMGALITYGSYVGKKDNIVSSAALITLMDVGIAFLAGLLMFPLVAFNNGGDMSSVDSGPGLIFVTLPGVFEQFGGAGIVVGAIFFLLLSFAALTSTVSLLEVPVSYVVDEHGAKRTRAVWITAAIIFVVGIPSLLSQGYSGFLTDFVTYLGADKSTTFLDFVDDIASKSFLPLGGFLISIFAAYVWKSKNLEAEIAEGFPKYKGSILSKYINLAIMVVCPLVLGSIFTLTVAEKFLGIEVFKEEAPSAENAETRIFHEPEHVKSSINYCHYL
ncbi:MAG: sodium-dependent transporter, partial [Bacteroidetes bacterium]|nr:sodium-dependent transporter [Bacteroidota bacterium]